MRKSRRKARKLTHHARRHSPGRLVSEQLEPRLVLAGNVTADIQSGFLRVIGDGLDNQVSIVGDGTTITVTGLEDTTINGGTGPLVAGITDGVTNSIASQSIVVRLGGGNDELLIDGVTATQNFVIRGGKGADQIEVTSATTLNGVSRIGLGRGNDTVSIAQWDAGGPFILGAGRGADTVVLGDIQVGGPARVYAGSGADRVLLAGAMQTDRGFVIKAGRGRDDILIAPGEAGDTATLNDTLVKLGSGGDQLFVDSQTTINGRLKVLGASGIDTLDNQGTNSRLRARSVRAGTVDSRTIIDAIFADLTAAGLGTDAFGDDGAAEAPSVTATDGNVTFNEDDDPLTIDSGITVTDTDSTDLDGASVAITAGFEDTDVLAATEQGAITADYDAATGVLTLSGTATLQEYQTVLQSVTYASTSDNPSTTTREITFEVTDPDGETGSATRSVDLTVANDAPTATASLTEVDYTAGDGAVTVDAGLALADPDEGDFTGATATISSGFVTGEDVLAAATDGTPITSDYDAATGVLTLSGVATIAEYQQVLAAMTFENTNADAVASTRTIDVSVSDGDLSDDVSYTVNIAIASSASPVVAASSAASQFVEDGVAVLVDPTITLTDDGDNLTSAEVSITTGFATGDVLTVTDQAGITSSFDQSTGVLTLTGSAGIAAYESALRSVAFESQVAEPDTTTRVIQFQVTDTDNMSGTAVVNVEIVATNDEPVLTTSITSLDYTEGDGATVLDSALTIADPDSTEFSTATVTIDGFQTGEDNLSFDSTITTDVSGDFDSATGILTFTGNASLAVYTDVLQSVTYENSSDTPNEAARTIQFALMDNALTGTASLTVNVTAVDPLSLNLSLPTEFSDPLNPATFSLSQPITFTPTLTGGDGTATFTVDVDDNPLPAGVSAPTIDSSTGAFSWTPELAGTYTARIIAVSADGLADQEEFTIVVTS